MQDFLKDWWKHIDVPLFIAIILLMVIGLVLTTTATTALAIRLHLPPEYFLKKEIYFLPISLIALFIISSLKVYQIRRLGIILFFVALMALCAIPFIGLTIKGATRWLFLGIGVIEPSEFIKPTFAIFSAWMLSSWKTGAPIPGHYITLLFFLIIAILLVMQPDLGQVVLLLLMLTAQFLIIGMPFIWLVIIGIFGILGMTISYFTFPHVTARLNGYLHFLTGHVPYQIKISLKSFQVGGMFGVGLGQGTLKYKLPDAHTDFILSVAAEELGIVFVLGLIALYAFIAIRTLVRLKQTYQLFIMVAVIGLIVQFFGEAVINIASDLGLIPTKGMPLPFVSSGLSSQLSTSITVGMILGLLKKNSYDNP